MPAPTAAVIYFMRTAVICKLPEPSQRRLLSELARATSHAIAPPAIIAAMEGCGVLLELLGALVLILPLRHSNLSCKCDKGVVGGQCRPIAADVMFVCYAPARRLDACSLMTCSTTIIL
jgi:hypothetical protein